MRYGFYITAVTWNREPILTRPDVSKILLDQVTFYRAKYAFAFCGFVVMPDHWHFLLVTHESEISNILRDMKSMISRKTIDLWKASGQGREMLKPFLRRDAEKRAHTYSLWQSGNWKAVIEECRSMERRLNYMHMNPVEKELVERAVDWPLSSARWYAHREPVGVEIDMDWLI